MAASWSSNMFAGAYQFNVHQLAEIFHGLSKDAVVHELEQVFLKVPDGFLLETYAAGGCDNAARTVSCRRSWGQPFHSLLALS